MSIWSRLDFSKFMTFWKNQRVFQCLILASLMAFGVVAAEAHVKWFFDYDVTRPPTPIGEVLDGTFVTMYLVSAALCYLFFLADRYIYEEGYLAEFDKKLKLFDNAANYIMRTAAGIFFLALFLWWALGIGQSFYLTPELKTDAVFVPWLQLAM